MTLGSSAYLLGGWTESGPTDLNLVYDSPTMTWFQEHIGITFKLDTLALTSLQRGGELHRKSLNIKGKYKENSVLVMQYFLQKIFLPFKFVIFICIINNTIPHTTLCPG